jgi:hypothetical protein
MRTQDMSPKGQKLRQTLADLALELEDRPVGGKDKARATKASASPKRRGRPPKSAGRAEEVRLMSDFQEPRRPSPKARPQSFGRASARPVRIVSSDWDDDRSYGRYNPSLVGAAETSYDASMDPEGAAMLHRYLEENYTRTTLDEACDEQIDVANDGRPDVAIWVKTGNKWRQMDRDSEVMTLWAKRLKNKPGSVCQSLVKDLLGLSDRDYENLRHKFDQRTGYIEGVYKAKPSKASEVEKFAVVVKMPSGMSVNDKWVKAGLGGLAALTTAAAAGATYYGRKKLRESYAGQTKDWKYPIEVVTDELATARRQLAVNKDIKDRTPPAVATEEKRLEKRVGDLEYLLAKYKLRVAQAAIDEAKTANDAITTTGAEKEKAVAKLKIAKARALTAASDVFAAREIARTEIAKIFAEQTDANNEYKTLFATLETPVLAAITKAKSENKLDATELKALKDAAKDLFELGDKIRPGWRGWVNKSAIPALSESSSAAAIKAAIISEFPEYALKFVKDGSKKVKEEPVAGDVAKKLYQFGLDVPSDDETVDELFNRIVDTKYSRQTSKAEQAIQKLMAANPATATVETLIAEQKENELLQSKLAIDRAIGAEITRLEESAAALRRLKGTENRDSDADAALEKDAEKFDALVARFRQ